MIDHMDFGFSAFGRKQSVSEQRINILVGTIFCPAAPSRLNKVVYLVTKMCGGWCEVDCISYGRWMESLVDFASLLEVS